MPEARDIIDRKLEDRADPALPMNEMWSTFSAEAWEAGDPELGQLRQINIGVCRILRTFDHGGASA